jgi:predicted MFS family arabinose efflux permease
LALVGGAMLVETVLFTSLAPLLPRYSDSLGLSKFGAGVLVGAYAAGGLAGALPGGWLASNKGVKVALISGLVLLSVFSVVFGFAGSVWLLDLSRFGQGVGASCAWTGALAWLVVQAPRDRRGELIGIAVGTAGAGAILGPAAGALATVVGVAATFVAIAVVAGALAVWALRVPVAGRGAGQSLALLLPAVRRPGIASALWLLALPSMAFGVLGVLAPLGLSRVGVSGAVIGVVFLVAAGLETVASVLGGRWADRSGRERPLEASLVGAALACFLLATGGGAGVLALFVVLALTAFGAFFVPAMALLADQAERAGLEAALAFALLNLAWAPGLFVGSTVGGALADATSDSVSYVVLALLCLVTLPALRHSLRLERASSLS